jgi:hypothetical protein
MWACKSSSNPNTYMVLAPVFARKIDPCGTHNPYGLGHNRVPKTQIWAGA